MINVTSVDHVVLRVNDVERVAQFYVEVLGASWDRRRDDLGLYHLRLGDMLLDLVDIAGPIGSERGGTSLASGRNVDHVAFRIRPWNGDAVLAHLQEHGISGEIKERYGAEGLGPSIYISDPEGNGVELKGPTAKTGVTNESI